MRGQHVRQRLGKRDFAPASSRLGRLGLAVPSQLLGYGHCAPKEVKASHSETGYLAPPQAEDGTEPHHRAVTGIDLLRDRRNVLRSDSGTAQGFHAWQVDAAARRPCQPVRCDCVHEQGTDHVVLPTGRAWRLAFGPSVDQLLYIWRGDLSYSPFAELRQDMQAEYGLVTTVVARLEGSCSSQRVASSATIICAPAGSTQEPRWMSVSVPASQARASALVRNVIGAP